MKVSINWLRELIDLKVPLEEVTRLLPLRTIGIKEVTEDSIELDMKGYNRADLLSMRGVALEVAAITDSIIKFNDDQVTIDKISQLGKNVSKISVKVEDQNLCPVYCLAKIENLKVEHSNDTWVKRLNNCGIRAINNVADVTNLVMLEYGQPMHAFDARAVKDESIIVRTARPKERITTLDGKTRDLDISDLLITDSQNALGLAGVMGGKDCEITDSTTTILLEAAIFDPVNIRRTSQRHNLPSEASRRFQHGLTKKRLLQALHTAIRMYEILGGKLTAINLIGDLQEQTKTVTLRQEKLNSLVGVEIKPEEVESYLTKLGFKVASHIESGTLVWEVTVPYWRLDIDIEEDLIEEVTRMYGYEKIPAKELDGEIPEKIDQSQFDNITAIKQALVKAGLTEVQTYSFYSTDVLNNLDWNKENLVKIANPISSETAYLREDIWPNLLEVVAKNVRQSYIDIGIFEVGKVYEMDNNQPKESYRVSLTLMNGSDHPTTELYQIFQGVKLVHLRSVQVGKGIKERYEKKYFHPKRFAFLEKDGQPKGGIAEVHQRFTDKFGINQRVAVLEFELES